MEILPTYGLASLLASSGLLAGFVLAHYVKEELKPGDKYFLILKYVIALSAFGVLFYVSQNPALFFILVPFLFVLHYYHKNYLITVEYALFGILFGMAWHLKSYETLALIFMYGIPTGTRYYGHKQNWLDIAMAMMVFVVVSLGLFFV